MAMEKPSDVGKAGLLVGAVAAIALAKGISKKNRGLMAMRGKTSEQKKIIKYFMSTGLLGAIFRISNDTYNEILNRKIREHWGKISHWALEAHGLDPDEVREIPPIYLSDFFLGSTYSKMFRDETFRASEYQISYLLFSDKQLYAYSYVFDLTSLTTIERTREFFYRDITSVDVIHVQNECLNPRPLGFMLGGIASILIGVIIAAAMIAAGSFPTAIFFGLCGIIAGIVIMKYLGYTQGVVDVLNLRLTVAGDEFESAMTHDNMRAIQGMKAKIREKK